MFVRGAVGSPTAPLSFYPCRPFSRSVMEPVRLAFRAMATRFEFVLAGQDPAALRAAGEEAAREIKRIEERFSFYAPASELSRLNREAAHTPVPCSGMMIRLLSTCRDLYRQTRGQFDPTVAPALSAWGLRHQHDSGSKPSEEALHALTDNIGMDHVEIDERKRSVRFARDGIQLDLGGVAKGWALDEARLLLEESGVGCALLHGGTSTAITIGPDPEGNPWLVGIQDPYESLDDPSWLLTVPLSSQALSVSAVRGKSFTDKSGAQSTEYGHVINPRTGHAVSGPRLTLVVSESATSCDAWSTAMLAGPNEHVPDHIAGTAFLKTDSGWTVTAGSVIPSWTSPDESPLLPTSSDD